MEHPLYTDWKFWSFFVSALALVASQLPPLRVVLRRGKLAVDIHNQIFLNHRFGNPNAQLHLIVSHMQGRKVRVLGINMTVSSPSVESFKLPARNYLQKEASKGAVIFTPFYLNAGEEWSHVVTFFPSVSRQDERMVREATSALQRDIQEKRKNLEDTKIEVEADHEFVLPFIDLFKRQFKWSPDEYSVTISLETDPPNAVPDKTLRFILFDWDVTQLKSSVANYRYGAGIYFEAVDPEGVIIPFQGQ